MRRQSAGSTRGNLGSDIGPTHMVMTDPHRNEQSNLISGSAKPLSDGEADPSKEYLFPDIPEADADFIKSERVKKIPKVMEVGTKNERNTAEEQSSSATSPKQVKAK